MLSHQGVELSERIRRLGGVALLEELCHWGRLSTIKTQSRPIVSLFQSVFQDVSLSYISSAICTTMLPAIMIMD